MHRVVKSHLNDFVKQYSVTDQEPKQFEAFLNYVVLRQHCAEHIDPRELVYAGDDPGLDGVMVFVNDAYVSSVEEVEDAMSDRKQDADVVIAFTQAKTAEAWSKAEINTFESAINDFLAETSEYPHSDYIKNAREVFNGVLKHVGKIRHGKPKVQAFFATTARASEDREVLSARQAIHVSLESTGYFSNIEVVLVDRDRIVEMWKAAEGQVEATLRVLGGSAAFPRTPGIEEGYAVIVRAKDFINQILVDTNGRLRPRIFEENVRDFLGPGANVNKEMAETIADQVKQKRFGVLNNGITMISPDVRVCGVDIFIRDFQIVNGCQTSNVLFENRLQIEDDATIMLKLIEMSDRAVVDDIIRSTNRQATLDEDQFLATLGAVKALERYFEARDADDERRLYFERRRNQFAHDENVKRIRVFDIKELARCLAAMFLDKPDIASRYPNRLTAEMRALVFDPGYLEEVYYVSAFTLYRIKLLIGNRRIAQCYFKVRWHIMLALKYYVCGDAIPKLNSKKIKKSCEDIMTFMRRGDDETVRIIQDLCANVFDMDNLTRDKLKGSNLAHDVKLKALAFRNGS